MPGLKLGNSFGIYHEVVDGTDFLTILDFPYHYNIVKKAWEAKITDGSGLSIYSAESQLRATSEWADSPVSETLLFGYSPTMLWLLLPLVPFSHAVAFFLFNAAGLIAVYWMTYPGRSRWGTGILLFFSAIANECFGIGQTAVLTGAGLLFLAERTVSGNPAKGWRDDLISGAALWALTAKPSVAIAAIAAIAALRRWRILAAAGLLTAITTLAASPWLGANWASDYIHILRSYDSVNSSSQYAWSVHPEYLSNLRGILTVNIGLKDNLAAAISSSVWLIAITGLIISGARSVLSVKRVWAISIVLYLLFCPHVSRTELLQTAVVLSLAVSVSGKLSVGEIVLLTTLPLYVLTLRPLGPPLESFIPLVVLFGFLVFFPEAPGATNRTAKEALPDA